MITSNTKLRNSGSLPGTAHFVLRSGGAFVALTAVLGLSLSLVLPASADPNRAPVFPNGPIYGLAGITTSQSFRLNLSNDATSPTARCRADVALVDDTSTTFATASTVVGPGATSQLSPADLAYSDDVICYGDAGLCLPTGSADVAVATAAPIRVQIRPVISLFSDNPSIPVSQACGRTQTSLELIDPSSRRTEAFWQSTLIHPRNAVLAAVQTLFPYDPIGGVIGTTLADRVRVNMVNTNLNPASASCPARIGIQDTNGVVLQQQYINLAPGQSVSIAQVGDGIVDLRPIAAWPSDPIGGIPCRGVVRTVEVVDTVSQKTRFFYTNDPVGGRNRVGF